LIARSPRGGRGNETGSLTRSDPAAIVALSAPAKVSLRSEPGTMPGPAFRSAIRAAPTESLRPPWALDRRTRSVSPPRLARTFIRKVWLLNATPSAGAGAVVQVPTQCRSVGVMARRAKYHGRAR